MPLQWRLHSRAWARAIPSWWTSWWWWTLLPRPLSKYALLPWLIKLFAVANVIIFIVQRYIHFSFYILTRNYVPYLHIKAEVGIYYNPVRFIIHFSSITLVNSFNGDCLLTGSLLLVYPWQRWCCYQLLHCGLQQIFQLLWYFQFVCLLQSVQTDISMWNVFSHSRPFQSLYNYMRFITCLEVIMLEVIYGKHQKKNAFQCVQVH